MEITFLGTSFHIPTKKRNHSAILLTYEGENILVDCGEGTQRQFRYANLNPCKITKMLITHWHGDHILGIPGILQTLQLSSYNGTLQIYGPPGTKRNMDELRNLFLRNSDLKLEVYDVKEGKIYEGKDLIINAYEMDHGVPCLAYSVEKKSRTRMDVAKLKKLKISGPIVGDLQRGKDIMFNGKKIKSKDVTYIQKGKKVTFMLDTKINSNCITAAKDADLLICEAEYLEENAENAEERKHLTATQAGDIAKRAKVQQLYLTHISQRYEIREGQILKEAKKKFKNVKLAEDLMKIEI